MAEEGSPRLSARVLVVDDEPDTRDVMKVILESYGADCFLAAGAEEGMRVLTALRPDLLLSDIAMPDEDGYAFVRKIRALPATEGGDTPAIAVSAHASGEDRQRAFAAGFNAFLSKPVNPMVLIHCIQSVLGHLRAHLERRRSDRRSGPPSWRVVERRLVDRRRLVEC